MYKICRAGGKKATDEFRFEDVKLKCVYEFAYLGDMLNDTGGVERAVAARVNIVYIRGVFENEKCIKHVLQHVDVWGRDLGIESRGFSEVVSHREEKD